VWGVPRSGMLDSDRADALLASELADGYVRPDYGGYCFAGVPAAAAKAVDVDLGKGLPADAFDRVEQSAQHVVVLFLDALGYRQFDRCRRDVPFLQSFVDAGRVTPLTSTFPSETAACVTTMHTATDPVEHGLLGWNAYDPEADAVYETLPYAAVDGGDLSLDPAELFDAEPVYRELAAEGVDAHVVEPDHGPGYRDAATEGATNHYYRRTPEFAVTLRDVLAGASAPSYTYAYYPVVDSVAHQYGPSGAHHDAQVAAVGDALERAFESLPDDVADETLVCLVADHGQVDVSGKAVNLDELGVTAAAKRDRSGVARVLGGPRNVHVQTDDPDAVRHGLAGMDGDALVLSREEALAEGLWGEGSPGPAFERNCGDLVVAPDEGMLLPARDEAAFENAGMHGGLHPGEALVPFGVARASDLK
jgi:hypothetical protein